MLFEKSYSPDEKLHLLHQLQQEKEMMIQEMNSLKEAGLYADSLKDSINENIVIMNSDNMMCKLNYLAYLPRTILRRAIADRLDKEELRYLFVILSEVNKRGIIRDITIYQLIQIIKAKYGEDNCNSSTYYKAHKHLVELGYIRYENNSIVVCGYAESFKSKKDGGLGSVVLPSFIYTYTFKNMSITAYRLMLEWMDLIGNISRKKTIYYKLTSTVAQRMRKRCPEEVRPAIKELSIFFDIKEEISSIDGLSNYHVSLKGSHIIDEKALAGIKQPVYIKHNFAFRYITKLLKHYDLLDLLRERYYRHLSEAGEYEDLDIYQAVATITKMLAKHLGSPLKKILSILRHNILNIKSIGAFLQSLIDVHIMGKSYDELELRQIKKQIDILYKHGYDMEAIIENFPDFYQKYIFLSKEVALMT